MMLFENMWLVGLVFFLIVLGVFIMARVTEKRPGRHSSSMFACGEHIESRDVRFQAQGQFRELAEALRIRKLREFHSGDLSAYLSWVFIGFVIILILLLLTW